MVSHMNPTKRRSVARTSVREDCSSCGTADSSASVEVLHDESAITSRPSVDIGRVACAVVVAKISPPNIVALRARAARSLSQQ